MDKLVAQLVNEMCRFVESLDITETKRSVKAFANAVQSKFFKEEHHA